MTGGAYADLVAADVSRRFACRSLKVYREISVGKTIIGKNRRIDVFCVCESTNKAFAIECKYQESEGTVDEKIPYAKIGRASCRERVEIWAGGTVVNRERTKT